MFARRDGHHTRQPETIQEFPGGLRPSLHKMSSLSMVVHLGVGGGGFSHPHSPTDTELVSYYRLFSSQREEGLGEGDRRT